MAASKNQIVGGTFQDIEGNKLVNGFLIMQLCGDEQATGSGQIGAGIKVRVPLDTNGDVLGTVLMWANDTIAPSNSYYIVKAYTHLGQLAWGPQYQQVLSSPSPFNIGVWVPNGNGCGIPSGPLTLQVNGVNNIVQTLLNLQQEGGIVLHDEGDGTVTVTSTGGGSLLLQVNGVDNVVQSILNLQQSTNMTIVDQGNGTVTFESSGGGGGVTLPGNDWAVLIEHPVQTFYDSSHFTWNDVTFNYNLGDGTNTITDGTYQFTTGDNNTITGLLNAFTFGESNTITADTNVGVAQGFANSFVIGDSNNVTAADASNDGTLISDVYIYGGNNHISSDTAGDLETSTVVGQNNTITVNTAAELDSCIVIGDGNDITATDSGTSVSGAWIQGHGNHIHAVTGGQVLWVSSLIRGFSGAITGLTASNAGSVDDSISIGTGCNLDSDGSGSNTSSIYSIGEANRFHSDGGSDTSDIFAFGEHITAFSSQSGGTVQGIISLGFQNAIQSVQGNLEAVEIYQLGDHLHVDATSVDTFENFQIGSFLQQTDTTHVFQIGENINTTSDNSVIQMGFSAVPEFSIRANVVTFKPLAFASLPACGGSTEGSLMPVTDSTAATWGSTVTGSGSNHVLAYCDGTNWTVAAI